MYTHMCNMMIFIYLSTGASWMKAGTEVLGTHDSGASEGAATRKGIT